MILHLIYVIKIKIEEAISNLHISFPESSAFVHIALTLVLSMFYFLFRRNVSSSVTQLCYCQLMMLVIQMLKLIPLPHFNCAVHKFQKMNICWHTWSRNRRTSDSLCWNRAAESYVIIVLF